MLTTAMKSVTVYTTDHCSLCVSAKALLERRGLAYREITLAREPDVRVALQQRPRPITFPQLGSVRGAPDIPRAGLKGLEVAASTLRDPSGRPRQRPAVEASHGLECRQQGESRLGIEPQRAVVV